jgi:hypothetical protein
MRCGLAACALGLAEGAEEQSVEEICASLKADFETLEWGWQLLYIRIENAYSGQYVNT